MSKRFSIALLGVFILSVVLVPSALASSTTAVEADAQMSIQLSADPCRVPCYATMTDTSANPDQDAYTFRISCRDINGYPAWENTSPLPPGASYTCGYTASSDQETSQSILMEIIENGDSAEGSVYPRGPPDTRPFWDLHFLKQGVFPQANGGCLLEAAMGYHSRAGGHWRLGFKLQRQAHRRHGQWQTIRRQQTGGVDPPYTAAYQEVPAASHPITLKLSKQAVGQLDQGRFRTVAKMQPSVHPPRKVTARLSGCEETSVLY